MRGDDGVVDIGTSFVVQVEVVDTLLQVVLMDANSDVFTCILSLTSLSNHKSRSAFALCSCSRSMLVRDVSAPATNIKLSAERRRQKRGFDYIMTVLGKQGWISQGRGIKEREGKR